MQSQFSRTALLLGDEAMNLLEKKKVLLFGVGGVGGYALEALVRSGIGRVDIVDNDIVAESNINRQIIALNSTIGQYKVDVAKERALDINPSCEVFAHRTFFLPENAAEFDFASYDYVIDAIDTVRSKLGIVMASQAAGVPVISSMGAGNKLDPTRFEVSDIYKTSVCPLAAAMRRLCRKNSVRPFKVVYSKEEPMTPMTSDEVSSKRQTPGSTAFVPSVVGLIIASVVVRELAGK